MNQEERNEWCFACGKLNPIGLKMQFSEQEDKYVAEFTPGQEHQSYDGIVHGGIISTLLDETMGRYYYIKGFHTVTAKLEVRFRHPTPIGQKITVIGWVTKERGKMIEMAAKTVLPDGTITAEGKAVLMIVGELAS
ncbi:MAG: ThioeSPTERase superfamily protein [Firmicutes bacterium]|nr:ThioeSPTERase superfamily protein [Bacillota bacterium]